MKNGKIERRFVQPLEKLIQDENSLVWNLTLDNRDMSMHEGMHKLGDFCYVSKGVVLHGEDGSFVKKDLISNARDTIHSKKYIEEKDIDKHQVKRVRFLEWDTERNPINLVARHFQNYIPMQNS